MTNGSSTSSDTAPVVASQRGGALYRLGETDAAIESHRHAMRLGGDVETAFLLADALVHGGRYKKANEIALDVSAAKPFYQPSFRVQLLALSTIRKVVPVDEQQRDGQRYGSNWWPVPTRRSTGTNG